MCSHNSKNFMKWFETIFLAVLSSGVTATIMEHFFNNRRDEQNRKLEFLEKQLTNLYGPLYWLISQSEKLFELQGKVMKAYDEEYCDSSKKYSQEKQTQDALKQETSITIEVANDYVVKVEENNKQMMVVLNNNYSYIDTDDIELFQLFYEHKVRNETEYGQERRLKLPTSIYRKIGNVSFLKQEVIDRIKNKFLDKKEKLERGIV